MTATACGILTGGATELSVATKFTVAKWYYLVGFTITAILTWVLRDYANNWFASNANAFQLCQESDNQSECGSQEVSIRISFANFCFFSLHGLCTLMLRNEDDWRVALHGGLWLWKTLLWAGALIGFFFVPSSALYGYAQVARVGAGFFLVLQVVLIIDFVYKISECLIEKDTRLTWAALVLGAASCFGLGLTLIGFSYHFFAPSGSCSLNLFFITWSLVILLALVGVLFLPNRTPTAGLLTSGAVFLYCSFLLYSALNSEPLDYPCRADSSGTPKWLQVVGFVVALSSVIYGTLTAGVASNDMFGEHGSLPYRADYFYLVFALASMYIGMLLSDWQVSPSTSAFEIDQGWVSTWVKMGSKWCCELLYLWTVVAPALFPNRDFGYKS